MRSEKGAVKEKSVLGFQNIQAFFELVKSKSNSQSFCTVGTLEGNNDGISFYSDIVLLRILRYIYNSY